MASAVAIGRGSGLLWLMFTSFFWKTMPWRSVPVPNPATAPPISQSSALNALLCWLSVLAILSIIFSANHFCIDDVSGNISAIGRSATKAADTTITGKVAGVYLADGSAHCRTGNTDRINGEWKLVPLEVWLFPLKKFLQWLVLRLVSKWHPLDERT